jgi:hypothetical protein
MASIFPTTTTKRIAKTATGSNELIIVGETIAVAAASLVAGTALGFGINLPKGAEIVFTVLDATDMDTNGTPLVTLGIGDAGSNVRFMAANTIAQTGAAPVGPQIAKAGIAYKMTAETLVQVYCVASAATAAAGTIKWAIAYGSQG